MRINEDYLSTERIIESLKKHGVPQEVADYRQRRGEEIATKLSNGVTDEMIAETETMSWDVRDFEQYADVPNAFAAAMFKFGKRFADCYKKDSEGNYVLDKNGEKIRTIEVRYTKIEDKDSGDGKIYPTFTIRNLALIEQHKLEEEARKEAEAAEKKRLEAERKKAEWLAKQAQKNEQKES